MIDLKTRLLVILISVGVLIYVINLVRTSKLREQFALLWLSQAFLFVVAAVFVDWLDAFSYALGIEYPPALFYLVAFLCLLFICFHFSRNISKLSDQNTVLIQELGLMIQRIEELEEITQKTAVSNSS